MANTALSAQLSSVSAALSIANSTVASLSTALSVAEASGSDTSAISSAVDAEDTTVAQELSTILAVAAS